MENLFPKKEDNIVSLSDWMSTHPSEEDMRNVFLNMDKAMKYIHNQGYCIRVFWPTEIDLINNQSDHVRFRHLVELSPDFSRKKKMIQEDIFNSSLIQIGLYGNCLNHLKPDFLKENFDKFEKVVPHEDIPYYRGVVSRGATVYFSDFAYEKQKRDLESFQKEFGDEGGSSKGVQLVKSSNGSKSISNDKINDNIYAQINGWKDAAFISYLMMPTLILTILLILGIIGWVISLI